MKTFRNSISLSLLLFSAGLALSVSAAEDNATPSQSVTVHAKDTREPISKYIYGQFIEHLGRCIYGGIWAEMLEDRKFYFPVTMEFKPWGKDRDRDQWGGGEFPVLTGSPWKVIGEGTQVRMVTDDPFVGKHTPEIIQSGTESGGIEQGELALETDREYVGYIIAAGAESAGPLQVTLIWGNASPDQEIVTVPLSDAYAKHEFRFRPKGSAEKGRLLIVGSGTGSFKIGTVSLMPADNVDGFRADTLQLLKELDSPVYRWPGGNFVSDYNWKDGVGDRDKRPPRKNPAWTGIEPNDVGIHEFMNLCRLLQTEPYIAVNTGLGTVEAAAEEVVYCNGGADTAMGKWRAENGHPESFGVKFWAVGNEMYGNWQLGHMPLEEYVKKHTQTVDAMRAVDPNVQLVGVGSVGEWSQIMLTHCADHMDLISEHIYEKRKDDLAAHVAQVPNAIKRVADAHRGYRKTIPGLVEKDIRIAMDEWNYWYGPYIYGELGVQYHLQDALGIAAGLHEYFRNSDMYFMANYAQTVNVIGAIKTTKTQAAFDTTGLVLKLYRREFGTTPVALEGDAKPLDVSAALSADGKSLTVGIVNPTEQRQSLHFKADGIQVTGSGKGWQIRGENKMAANVPGKEPEVKIVEVPVPDVSQPIAVEPMSVTLYSLPVK